MCLINKLLIIAVLVPLLYGAAPDLILHIHGKEDVEIDKKIREALTLVHRDRFSAALKIFEEVKKKYPNHPVGYFFVAATLDARMAFYQSNNEEAEFVKNCEKAIELGEAAMQAWPDDTWNLFFTGGSYGTLGAFQGRYKRYITSFRNGLSGVDLLKQVYKQDQRFMDALFGMGVYTYWSSRLSKMLWWMPGVSDNRDEGIRQLKSAAGEGVYAAFPSVVNLAQILNLEKRYEESVELAEKWLKDYHDNRALSYHYAEALLGLGNLEKAKIVFRKILDFCDSEDRNNYVWPCRCRAQLADIAYREGDYLSSLAHCKRGLAYKFNATEIALVSESVDALKSIRGKVSVKLKIER